MKIKELTQIDCEQDDKIVVRIFSNGQYLTHCESIQVWRNTSDQALVFDIDIVVSEKEK